VGGRDRVGAPDRVRLIAYVRALVSEHGPRACPREGSATALASSKQTMHGDRLRRRLDRRPTGD
jgi:hypothetical protein